MRNLVMVALCGALGCGDKPARTPDHVDQGAGAVLDDAEPAQEAAPVTTAPAETAEAAPAGPERVKSIVNAIARAAHAAYERESVDPAAAEKGPTRVIHALCRSAAAVPPEVPKGTSYTPTEADFAGEDATKGWHCLKFSLTEPLPCQLSYQAGRGYKSTKRGNKALKEDPPGKPATGFEAAAECDFDGDGETSLYARTATVDTKFQQLGAAEDFVDKEGE